MTKEFNASEAAKGKAVCTKDGRDVRILCFDHKDQEKPIIALVGDGEQIVLYSHNGVTEPDSPLNLQMKVFKKEGWINILEVNGLSPFVFPDKKLAVQYARGANQQPVATIKIELEE